MIFPTIKKSSRLESSLQAINAPNRQHDRSDRKKTAFLEPANVIFIIALIIAISFLAMMRRENQNLRSKIAVLAGTLAGSPEAQPGDIVPSIHSINLQSQKVDIGFNHDSRRLLYIFSADCGTCLSQFPHWNRLAALSGSKNLPVTGISIDGLDESRSRLNFVEHDFDIVVMPNESTKRAYRVVAVPEVLLISADGIVEWAHYGGLTEKKIEELIARIERRSIKSS